MAKTDTLNLEWKMKTVLALMRKGGFETWSQFSVAEARDFNSRPRNPVTDLFFGKPIPLPFVKDIAMTGRNGTIPGRTSI